MNSMSDLFHARVPVSFIRDVFDVCRDTPQHTYQVLTKRSLRLRRLGESLDWPSNLWMGVSVENAGALPRVDHLRDVPAAVRFLSCEPLIGPLDGLNLAGIHWVIAGGESGANYRRVDGEWVRGIRDACQDAGVAFFFKQWGGRTPKAEGRELDGRRLGRDAGCGLAVLVEVVLVAPPVGASRIPARFWAPQPLAGFRIFDAAGVVEERELTRLGFLGLPHHFGLT